MNRIKSSLKSHKVLIENFTFLSLFQVFNLLLPFITYPYLIRVLGTEKYGVIVFAQTITSYLSILISFGFNLSATQVISKERNNKNKISEIISSVYIIKFLLFIASTIIMVILIISIPMIRQEKEVFLFTLGLCLNELIFPVWYFQGIEKMKFITFYSLSARLIFTGLVLILIKSPNDYQLVPLINSIGAIISGILAIYHLRIKDKIKFILPNIITVKLYFMESIALFLSQLSTQIYFRLNKVLVGAFLGMNELAYFDLADKILVLLKMPIQILSQALFPKVALNFNYNFLKKIYIIVFVIYFTIILFFEIFAHYIIMIIGGEELLPAIPVARLLVVALLPLIVSNLYGTQILLTHNYKKQYTKIMLYSVVVYFMAFLLLYITQLTNLTNLALIQIIVEIYMLMKFLYAVKHVKIIKNGKI